MSSGQGHPCDKQKRDGPLRPGTFLNLRFGGKQTRVTDYAFDSNGPALQGLM
jgi:hypothetical protein